MLIVSIIVREISRSRYEHISTAMMCSIVYIGSHDIPTRLRAKTVDKALAPVLQVDSCFHINVADTGRFE